MIWTKRTSLNNMWKYHAIRQSDGAEVTPHTGSINRNDTYTIFGTEVVPCVGAINKPHWRSLSNSDYSRPFGQARETSQWHMQRTEWAIDMGFIDEYVVDDNITGNKWIADAYDPATNTLYEFVWSHDDLDKVDAYFDLGYNQVWIYADSKQKQWKSQYNYLRKLNPHYWLWGMSHSLREEIKQKLPTIGVRYE